MKNTCVEQFGLVDNFNKKIVENMSQNKLTKNNFKYEKFFGCSNWISKLKAFINS